MILRTGLSNQVNDFTCNYYDIEEFVKCEFKTSNSFSILHANIHSTQSHIGKRLFILPNHISTNVYSFYPITYWRTFITWIFIPPNHILTNVYSFYPITYWRTFIHSIQLHIDELITWIFILPNYILTNL